MSSVRDTTTGQHPVLQHFNSFLIYKRFTIEISDKNWFIGNGFIDLFNGWLSLFFKLVFIPAADQGVRNPAIPDLRDRPEGRILDRGGDLGPQQ